MKKLYYLFIAGVVAASCGDKDRYLYSQLPAEPAVNAGIKVLIKDNSLNSVRLDSGGIIRGLTTNSFFTSSDEFKNFTYAGYPVPVNNRLTPFSYSRNGVAIAAGTTLAPVIFYSLDFGSNWSTATLTAGSFSPAISTSGYNSTELVNVAYIDSNNLLMTYQQKAVTEADSRKHYKLNLKTKIATRVSYFDDTYYPVDVKFVDNKTGYMLLFRNSGHSSYISKTLDTGRTWTEPKLIVDRVLAGLQTGVKGSLCAHEEFGNAYMSADSGVTWKKPSTELKLTAAYMANQSVVYGVTQESLMKSTDTGVTWNTVSSVGYEYINMKKLHFQDDQNGLMYGGQKLFITADGGVTWKALLYPYPYVMAE